MGSTALPAFKSATTVRWPGIIQKNTFALMLVANMAPTSKNAARPANQWQANHAATPTSTVTKTPTMVSPFFCCPKLRQIPS